MQWRKNSNIEFGFQQNSVTSEIVVHSQVTAMFLIIISSLKLMICNRTRCKHFTPRSYQRPFYNVFEYTYIFFQLRKTTKVVERWTTGRGKHL